MPQHTATRTVTALSLDGTRTQYVREISETAGNAVLASNYVDIDAAHAAGWVAMVYGNATIVDPDGIRYVFTCVRIKD